MIHLSNWTATALGTSVELFASLSLEKLTSLRPILLMGGVHGDEPEGVWLARRTLQMLEQEKGRVRAPWVLIPCLNPDGFSRKTRVNGRGVDLNRNYPSANWQASYEKERYYPGPAPGSEPEVQAVVKLLTELRPRLVIHCHSWKPCIVFAGEPARKDAERLAQSSGYELLPEIGYPTPGALSQFGWADRKIPIICIEEKTGASAGELWARFEKAMLEIFADGSMR